MKLLYKILLCLALCIMLSSALSAQVTVSDSEESSNKKARTKVTRFELRGDRAFITGDYDAAMELYEQTAERLKQRGNTEAWLRMELKLARVYNMLQNHENVVKHYKLVLDTDKLSLEVEDVCYYVDALLALGRTNEAEVVARQFYYLNPYSNNQRYLNTINSLANVGRYYGTSGNDFGVTLHRASSKDAEYWLYEWEGQLFCAFSDSPLMDPRKVFFHRTRFYGLDNALTELERFTNIPREVQNGPSTNYGNYWIVTVIDYQGSDRIHGVDVREMFRTRLYYTIYDEKRGGWKAPAPLFDKDDGASYAHPVLFNEGKSLVFSSDMPGGYGGMDLYIAHLDEDTGKWGKPQNLGPQVNTEGDEIFPTITEEGEFYFSSNGLEGYGGYDIYGAEISANGVNPASLFHYPYPVNSAYNDYGFYSKSKTANYFISDRRGSGYRDDLYSFSRTATALASKDPRGASKEDLALRGNLRVVDGLSQNVSRQSTRPKESDLVVMPVEGEVLLSVYFDFNISALSVEAVADLQELLKDPRLAYVEELMIAGYADEIGGGGSYNLRLSQRRARTVATYLLDNAVMPDVLWEGYGSTKPDEEDYRNQLEMLMELIAQQEILDTDSSNVESVNQIELPLRDRIRLIRTARRVDIIVSKVR